MVATGESSYASVAKRQCRLVASAVDARDKKRYRNYYYYNHAHVHQQYHEKSHYSYGKQKSLFTSFFSKITPRRTLASLGTR
eukprot:scaffold3642_cov182-Amphora_coffeaeformis.AAC.2